MTPIIKALLIPYLAIIVIVGCSSPQPPAALQHKALYLYVGENLHDEVNALLMYRQDWDVLQANETNNKFWWKGGAELDFDNSGKIIGGQKLPSWVKLENPPVHVPTPKSVLDQILWDYVKDVEVVKQMPKLYQNHPLGRF